MHTDQQACKPWRKASSRYWIHSGSSAMSDTTTVSPRQAAVPQDPAQGPIGMPSMPALYASGRLGAAAVCRRP